MLDHIFSVHFITVTVTFFLLMDSLGNIPLFLSLLRNVSAKRLKKVIFRELVIALFIMVLFAFGGKFVLSHLGIKNQSLQIAGGIILFVIAMRMIFTDEYTEAEHTPDKEPLIVPLAIPLVAGPTVLTTIMIYSDQPGMSDILLPAIFVAWILTAIILVLSAPIRGILGDRGIGAVEKLMGLILTLIAVQLFLDGLYTFLHS